MQDVLSPSYYLLLPTGKIRDATFIGGKQSDADTCIVVMSTTGFVYTQTLNEESLAVHGTFYLTNVLTVSSCTCNFRKWCDCISCSRPAIDDAIFV